MPSGGRCTAPPNCPTGNTRRVIVGHRIDGGRPSPGRHRRGAALAGTAAERAVGWVDALDGEVTLELRRLYENEDFGDALPQELRDREDRLRAELERK